MLSPRRLISVLLQHGLSNLLFTARAPFSAAHSQGGLGLEVRTTNGGCRDEAELEIGRGRVGRGTQNKKNLKSEPLSLLDSEQPQPWSKVVTPRTPTLGYSLRQRKARVNSQLGTARFVQEDQNRRQSPRVVART